MENLQEAYLAIYEANKADEFVTSNMYTADKDIKDAKKRRRQNRDFEGILNPADYESQGEPVRQQKHRSRRGVRNEESDIAARTKRAVGHQRGGTHGDDHAMERESEESTKSVKKATKHKGPKVMPSMAEDVDFYDVVLDYLLDEGYADTEDNAITIMANMSEEWKTNILNSI